MLSKAKLIYTISSILVLCFFMTSCGKKSSENITRKTTYKLYFLGGQSNMEGFGFNSDLPKDYQEEIPNVMIFNGNQASDDSSGGGFGKWMSLSGGFGTGYFADADTVILSKRFGLEVSFGKQISQLTGEKIAVIKYARGGSSIAIGGSGFGTWAKEYNQNSTINQWDNFVTTVKNAFSSKDIDGDGIKDTLIPAGIIWMQGEADAYNEEASKVYLKNLTKLMNDISKVFSNEKLTIVLGRIEDSGKTPAERVMPYIKTVWDAQKKYVRENDNAELIRLDKPVEFIEDKWHYKSKHYVELGKKFADAVYKLENRSAK